MAANESASLPNTHGGTIDSHLFYVIPSTLERATSIYRDKANTGVALIDTALPDFKGLRPRLSIGGTLYYSVWDSATRYYQPFGRFLAGFNEHISVYVEWRWYGMTQPVFLIQGFRSNQMFFGLRASR
jgi:hypothetical protein